MPGIAGRCCKVLSGWVLESCSARMSHNFNLSLMKTDCTEEEIFRSSSKEELKSLAAKGQLAWKGKKVVLDPFAEIEFFYLIEVSGDNFTARGKFKIGAREED